MPGKGHGMGGCCCGGCRSPIYDGRASTDAIIPAQQYCCRCIPDQICVSINATGTPSIAFLERVCLNGYTGDPIQYRENFYVGSGNYQFNFRTIVESGRCYIGWDAPDLNASGRTIVDSGVPCTGSCDNVPSGSSGINCVCFSGHWHHPASGESLPSGSIEFDLIMTKPSTIDLVDKVPVPCGGCNCICDCMCLSIWYQQSGNLEFIGSNEIVCSQTGLLDSSGCGEVNFCSQGHKVQWSGSNWIISLEGGSPSTPSGYTINSGIGSVTGICTVPDALCTTDGYEHIVDQSGSINIIYDFDTGGNDPRYFTWVGRSYDESSNLLFEAYNFSTTGWDSLRTVGGRPIGSNINQAFKHYVDSDYTDGSGFRLRISSTDASQLVSDKLNLTTYACCELALLPSGGVVPSGSTISNFPLSGQCPSPEPFWNFLDTESRDWYIYADCSWCDDSCGTVGTLCCNRPLPRVLVATVDLDCPNCGGIPFDVALVNNTSNLWQGSEPDVCGTPFDITLSCNGGSGFLITANGAGACNFTQQKQPDSCDPLYISYSGLYENGLGCCGPTATGIVTSTPITITVYE